MNEKKKKMVCFVYKVIKQEFRTNETIPGVSKKI